MPFSWLSLLCQTLILTYSMVQSPSWEANWSAASQEIPRILWNLKVHYRTPLFLIGISLWTYAYLFRNTARAQNKGLVYLYVLSPTSFCADTTSSLQLTGVKCPTFMWWIYNPTLCSAWFWKTNLMSLAILFHFLCAQHVSDINISNIGSLRLCCWITTSVVLFCKDGWFSVSVNLWCIVVCLVWCALSLCCSW